MKPKIEQILDLILEEIAKGKKIEECLKDYSDFVEELGPLLQIAKHINELPKPIPDETVITETLTNVKRFVTAQKQVRKEYSLKSIFSFQPAMIRAIATIILILIFGWVSISFSVKSLPGEFLYPIKIFTEKIHYILTINNKGKTELHIIFADRRTQELAKSFKKDEQLNRELLDTMLKEAHSALKLSESLSDTDTKVIIRKMDKIYHCQLNTLQELKKSICGCDTVIINNAINTCVNYHRCIEQKLNPQSNTLQSPCPCSTGECNCK